MHALWALIVGTVIGAIADTLTSKGQSMGWIANIVIGLVDSSIGEKVLDSWGPHVTDMAIMPSIIGAIILIAVIPSFSGQKNS